MPTKFFPQGQQQHQSKVRARTSAPPPTPTAPPASPPSLTDLIPDDKKKSTFQSGADSRAAGQAGEQNLSVVRIDVELGYARTARFDVKTAPGNTLEVLVEQAGYSKSYTGTGAVGTVVLPVVPVGTKGKLTARDTITGEVLEHKWTWINLGRSGFSFWSLIKRLLG